MDELAEYAAAQLALEYGEPPNLATVIMHTEKIRRDESFHIAPCDHRQEPYSVVDCARTFVVANGPLYRYYLVGQCSECGRVHVFLRGETRH